MKKYFVGWATARKPLTNAIILWRDHIYTIADQFGPIAPDLHVKDENGTSRWIPIKDFFDKKISELSLCEGLAEDTLFKVVGRISSAADSVKVGDEFDKNQVKEYGICCSPDFEHGIAHHGCCGECPDFISGFMIKGSDGKFR